MKLQNLIQLSLVVFPMATLAATAQAASPASYVVTLTNAGSMPFSPPVLYVRSAQSPLSKVGTKATRGFIEICQSGMTATRQSELKADSSVQSSQVIPSMIQPGETKTITLAVNDPTKQSLQVETMYGKTKDICAVGSIGSHALYALQQHVTSEVSVKDDVVETGAFTRPSVGMHAYPNADICPGAKDGVTCLRAISQAATSPSTIRFFSPYLPSVLDAIESKYGSLDAESLNLPSSGALRITVTLKH